MSVHDDYAINCRRRWLLRNHATLTGPHGSSMTSKAWTRRGALINAKLAMDILLLAATMHEGPKQ